MNLTIDQELKSIIPPLTKEEYEQLEKNCLQEGIREKILIWNFENEKIIIDGHNRYAICQKHNLPFETKDTNFNSKNEAKRWIILNQIGRRNITHETRNYLIGKLYQELKLDKLDNLLKCNEQRQTVLSIENPTTTAQKIADKYKVSERTVRRSEQFATAIDTLEKKFGNELKNKILSREVDLSQQDALNLTRIEEEKQQLIADKLINGDAKTLRDAKIQTHFDLREKEIQAAPPLQINNNFEYNKLYLGSAPEILKTFPDQICDCCIFDPPYGVDVDFDKTLYPDFNDGFEYAMEILDETCKELARVMKPNAHIYIFFAIGNITEVKAIISKYFELSSPIPLVWAKNTNGKCNFKEMYAPSYEPIWFCSNRKRLLNRDLSKDVLFFNSVQSQQKIHYAEKPIELLKYLVENSTIENEVVLDCFAGSASTLRAAKALNRKYLGIEISEDIYRIGLNALENEI